MRVLITFALLAVMAVSACRSAGDIIPVGKDTYLIGSSAMGGIYNATDVAAPALQKANEFCRSQGRELTLQSLEGRGVRGYTPLESQIVFTCKDPTDPAYHDPALGPKPTVIELRHR